MYKIIYVMSMQIMRLRRQPNACRNRTGETGWIVAKLSAANAANRTVLQGPSWRLCCTKPLTRRNNHSHNSSPSITQC